MMLRRLGQVANQSVARGSLVHGLKIARRAYTSIFDESQLPSLPVPPLEATAARYLRSQQPLLSPKDYDACKARVDDLLKGAGPELQKRLEEKAARERNWLEPLWEKYAYLESRKTPAVNVNLGGPVDFRGFWPAREGTHLARLSVLLYYALKTWRKIQDGKMPLDLDSKGKPLCMYQLYRSCATNRVPGIKCDHIDYHDNSRHVVLLANGRIVRLDVLNEHNELISLDELTHAVSVAAHIAQSQPVGPSISVLTTLSRPRWAHVRTQIIETGGHQAILDIESAVIGVCLDDMSPKNIEEVTNAGLQGDWRNRWYDKCFQIIMFKNGLVAMNGEHSVAETMVYVRFFHEMSPELASHVVEEDARMEFCKRSAEQYASGDHTLADRLGVREIAYPQMKGLEKIVEEAHEGYQKLAVVDVKLLDFTTYGKRLIKQYKVHPDIFLQMVLQLAFYRTHGFVCPTLETATTRNFYHGRTDLIRVVSNESVAFVKAMMDPAVNALKKLALFQKAAEYHAEFAIASGNGHGVDRHLLGLNVMAEELHEEKGLPIPEFFEHESFTKNTKTGGSSGPLMFASPVGYTTITWGGSAPMVKDGYNTHYTILDDSIRIYAAANPSSKITNATKFVENVGVSLNHMVEVVNEALKMAAAAKRPKADASSAKSASTQ